MAQKALQSSLVSIRGFVIDPDIWFEPKPGLNVIYGKNGVGKSTLINFIEAIGSAPVVSRGWASGQQKSQQAKRSSRSEAEQGVGRVVVNVKAPELVAMADELALEIKRGNRAGVRRVSLPYGQWRDEAKKIAQLLAKKPTEQTEWTDEEVFEGIAGFTDQSPTDVMQAVDSLRQETGTSEMESAGLLWEVTKQILQKRLDPNPVRKITEALRKTVSYHYTEWEPESALVTEINERLSSFGIDDRFESESTVVSSALIKELQFGDLFLLYVDVIICRLQYELNESVLDVDSYCGDEHGRLAEFEDDNPLSYSSVHSDVDEVIGIVARAVFEQRISLHVSYDYHYGPATGHPLRLLFMTAEPDGIGVHTAEFEKLRQSWNDMYAKEESSFEDDVCRTWLLDSAVVGVERLDSLTSISESLPIYEMHFPMGEVKELPFEVFRLDDNLELDKVVSELAAMSLDKELFEALALLNEDDIVGDQLSEFVKPLMTVIEPVEQFITALGIGIDGIQIEVSSRVRDWISGKGIGLSFLVSPRNVSFDRLSTAQQYWVKAGMRLVAAKSMNSRVLVLADEPDGSLHERAAYNVMEALGDSGLDIVVSSHSVAALRTRKATLHHLEVAANRRRTVSEVAVGNDVLVAAERLGTTPYDLLSLKRMMVLVEGAHDEAVIGRLLSLSENKLLSDRVLIAAMRGVKNVVSAADSVLVTEFSELSLLVVVDNGRNEMFKPILSELRELDSTGASEKELKKILASHRKSQDASFEERMLFDLLERAIHRGILRRLDLFALSVGDVIELLPVAGFGSSLTWEELRQQYQRSGLRTDFKAWLRETHQISVSVKTIEEAFDNSDSVHPELTRLLQEIELGCSVG
jgi:ABC-type lipoprotein export system ATPase subunit